MVPAAVWTAVLPAAACLLGRLSVSARPLSVLHTGATLRGQKHTHVLGTVAAGQAGLWAVGDGAAGYRKFGSRPRLSTSSNMPPLESGRRRPVLRQYVRRRQRCRPPVAGSFWLAQ